MTSSLTTIALAGVLAAATACGDERAPAAAAPTAPAAPPVTATTYPPQLWLGANSRELMLGDSVLISASLFVNNAPDEVHALAWTADVSGTFSVEPRGSRQAVVRGLRAGAQTLVVSADQLSGGQLSTLLPIRVLLPADSGATSPIVVEDFRVFEYKYPLELEWRYSPQLVLRDRTGERRSAVIAASFDIPGVGRTAPCAMRREIGIASQRLFDQDYFGYELSFLPANTDSRIGAAAAAHLTVRVAGGRAVRLTVHGRVTPEPQPRDEIYSSDGDMLSCW